ncbi:MAG: putative TIM-barrel fold metal-dependent hydrolase [Planctomycetota bacterium]|jgi:predicted TIM-barrel fold metal-dependent hydrolase
MATLVDIHSHLFSRVFFETLSADSPFRKASSLSIDESIARTCRDVSIDEPSQRLTEHVARWLAELDEHGVNHLVTFASVPEEAEVVQEAVRLADGRMTGFAVVNPATDDSPARLAKLFDEMGMRGILLFPALHGYRVDDPSLAKFFEALEERGGIAVVHCGLLSIPLRDRFGLRRPQDITLANPLFLMPVANRHRRATFLIPHMGAGMFRETLMLGSQCENVMVDTSSSNGWVKTQATGLSLADALERVLAVFGPERVIFGTDSSVFPRGWRRDILLAQREAMGSIGTPAEHQELIFGGNAMRLLLCS